MIGPFSLSSSFFHFCISFSCAWDKSWDFLLSIYFGLFGLSQSRLFFSFRLLWFSSLFGSIFLPPLLNDCLAQQYDIRFEFMLCLSVATWNIENRNSFGFFFCYYCCCCCCWCCSRWCKNCLLLAIKWVYAAVKQYLHSYVCYRKEVYGKINNLTCDNGTKCVAHHQQTLENWHQSTQIHNVHSM